MITIINCAKKKHGKTSLTKAILNSFPGPKYIYDVNGEYKDFGSAAVFPRPFTKFMESAVQMKETCIVFEEASIFFSHQGAQGAKDEMVEMLVRNRHTKNLIILNFHSINKIPSYIWDHVTYLILGKTNDKPKWVEREYKETDLLEAYNYLKDCSDRFEKITLNIDLNGV